MSLVQQVPLEDLIRTGTDVRRAGVIPYAEINGQIYWLMGKAPSGRWTDFGGNCIRETAYQCALREVIEESSDLLTKIVNDSLNRNQGVYVWRAQGQSRAGPLFYRYLILVPIAPLEYNAAFRPNSEILSLHWISQAEVLNPNINIDIFLTSIAQFIRNFRKLK